MILSIIDCGSQNFTLQSYSLENDQLQCLGSPHAIPLKLSEKLDSNSSIDPSFIPVITQTILDLTQKASEYQPDTIICFGTQFFRSCRQTPLIIQHIEQHCSLSFSILSPKDEAFYSMFAVRSFFSFTQNRPVYSFDLGGGSLEIGFLSPPNGFNSQSFPKGLAFLKKQNLCGDFNLDFAMMNTAMRQFVHEIVHFMTSFEADTLVTTSSFGNLYRQWRNIDPYQSTSPQTIQYALPELVSKSYQPPSLRPLLFLGFSLLGHVLHALPIRSVHFCPWSIREGFAWYHYSNQLL